MNTLTADLAVETADAYPAAFDAAHTLEARADKDDQIEIALDALTTGDPTTTVLTTLYQHAFIQGYLTNATTTTVQLWHAHLETHTIAALLTAEQPSQMRHRHV